MIATIPDIPVIVMVTSSAIISGIGGTLRSCRRQKPASVAAVDGLLLACIGFCGSMIAVVWLAGGSAPHGAEYAIVGVAGLAGLLGVSFWDAALRGLFGRWLERVAKKVEGKDDE